MINTFNVIMNKISILLFLKLDVFKIKGNFYIWYVEIHLIYSNSYWILEIIL